MDCCIELPIFCHNEKTSALAKIGMDYDIRDCDLKTYTFLTINMIDEYYCKELERRVCEIGCNGDFFKADIAKQDLLKLLNIIDDEESTEGETAN